MWDKNSKELAASLQGRLFLRAALCISGLSISQLSWHFAILGPDGEKICPTRQFYNFARGQLPQKKSVKRIDDDFPSVAKWRTSGLIEITQDRWFAQAYAMMPGSRRHLPWFEASRESRGRLRALLESSEALDTLLGKHDVHEQGQILARILVSVLSVAQPEVWSGLEDRRLLRPLIATFHTAARRLLAREPYRVLASEIYAGLERHLNPDESRDRIREPPPSSEWETVRATLAHGRAQGDRLLLEADRVRTRGSKW